MPSPLGCSEVMRTRSPHAHHLGRKTLKTGPNHGRSKLTQHLPTGLTAKKRITQRADYSQLDSGRESLLVPK
jgi:hypothetical protein